MPKNFFKRLKESMIPSRGNQDDKSLDFERAKEILFSSKNLSQLVSAVRYINNFNKKYGINEQSPEFIYFERMIKLMRVKIRSERIEDSEIDEGHRMNRGLRYRIKESLDGLNWIKDIVPTPPREWGEVRVGDIMYIGEKYAPRFLLNIIEVTDKNVKYEIIHSEDPDERVGKIGSLGINYVRGLITENHFWKYYVVVEGGEPPSGPYESYTLGSSLNESNELDWIKNQQTNFHPKFEFNDVEYWVDISGLDTSEKIVVLNFILDLESIDDRERDFYRRYVLKNLSIYNGVVVHCGNEGNDYVPKNGEICFMRTTFNDDEQTENSIHVDGREVLEYINLINGEEEELEESLEWSDKDSSYSSDEKFTADPNWKGDENWTPNPEKSYWKQGDAGGGDAGGGDMNESQDLDWIKDVSDKLPSYDQRTRIDLKDFLIDYMKYNVDILDFLHSEDIFVPTERFIHSYTPEEWDDEGVDYWRDVAWKEEGNSKWEYDEPPLNYWELLEYLMEDSDKWEFIDRTTDDYDLEYGSFSDLYIYKRKKDGRYFALPIKGNTHDGITHNDNFLFEVFPRMRLVYESRKDLIKKILAESKLN